ncbi:D-glycero-beta-D-manno-heptose 1,7-bisphosphate 7-phosphatase [Neiella marina]|uniref:D,D-heptose 1,7-bisphosphate phosphatase n=1 Tax=Neiella holothuriorum TaxID=2870530 RepID=A0ABS7EKR8_9GAMM|nr:D-glycero-beta-D-manno-heptose 1,7-bisphosphate 7-phosphatase [Neiella holothuriorum]MBW8192966.1 D-glycero-beta-D-manno-heptose 1,7-bisphosphate 7-phosphatase [Neiella holothuriorum]
MSAPSPAVFLDRDGVINLDTGYTHKVEDLVILPGVAKGCRRLIEAGFKLVIVTNQSGIARGLYTKSDYQRFTERLLELLATQSVHFHGVYFCPHHQLGEIKQYSKDCDCRKPKPGMLLEASKDLSLDLSKSYMVGDRPSDLEAAVQAGVIGQVLIATGKVLTDEGIQKASFVADDFLAATDWILTNSK